MFELDLGSQQHREKRVSGLNRYVKISNRNITCGWYRIFSPLQYLQKYKPTPLTYLVYKKNLATAEYERYRTSHRRISWWACRYEKDIESGCNTLFTPHCDKMKSWNSSSWPVAPNATDLVDLMQSCQIKKLKTSYTLQNRLTPFSTISD